MNTLEKLEKICIMFKEDKIDIEEFQSRLETLDILGESYVSLNKVKIDAINRLEEIRYCSLESNFYKYGSEVANLLLEEIKEH
ncbi:hypothetical protein [Clostridium sp. 'White wine YQ']|uniref:hypothetical protein n=1 Tax=Clostridium sp. 'White wine YQ' TaxID=3027474 RepID=UPI00236679FE|nr:hypothetical protein [Clostridium sp. 'White wine YQ']MDD7793073.1 hypothetical protein [Clostridium sp. 'White wine YQ']